MPYLLRKSLVLPCFLPDSPARSVRKPDPASFRASTAPLHKGTSGPRPPIHLLCLGQTDNFRVVLDIQIMGLEFVGHAPVARATITFPTQSFSNRLWPGCVRVPASQDENIQILIIHSFDFLQNLLESRQFRSIVDISIIFGFRLPWNSSRMSGMRVFFIGICGTAMGNAAVLLKSGVMKSRVPMPGCILPCPTSFPGWHHPIRRVFGQRAKGMEPDRVVVGNAVPGECKSRTCLEPVTFPSPPCLR